MDAAYTWPALLGQLIKGESLSGSAAAWAMTEIMAGAATPAQIAGFGIALRMKGESPAEVDGLASAMLRLAAPLTIPGRLTDLVGRQIVAASEQRVPGADGVGVGAAHVATQT